MDDAVVVSCMEHVSAPGKNSFKWPKTEDVLSYAISDILCQIDAPVPINQRGHFSLSSVDISKLEKGGQC